MAATNKLGDFLKEVSNWRWDEFAQAERDMELYTTNQSLIFALVRACAMQKMEAIKLSLNRLDGKLKTPIKIEYPKIFWVFPNATLSEGERPVNKAVESGDKPEWVGTNEIEVINAGPDDGPEPEKDLPSMSLRQTLTEMAEYARNLPQGIVDLALQTEQWLKHHAEQPYEIPLVKSVVAAHLLVLAQHRNIDALTEVFDQIDGKLVETYQILGEDIYITSYSLTAPPGAYLNKKGVLEIEAPQIQQMWEQKLGKEGLRE